MHEKLCYQLCCSSHSRGRCSVKVRLRHKAAPNPAVYRRSSTTARSNGDTSGEFLQLFLKNHYPLLKKVIDSGRMLSVKIETPANHMTEESRWDYRVTIHDYKNSTLATTENPDEAKMVKQLWPDEEK